MSDPRQLPEPSVGRDVHYVSYGTPGGEYPSVCRAAKITEVNGGVYAADDQAAEGVRGPVWFVGLCVFNPTGLFFNQNVMHDEDSRAAGTWHWPERVGEK